MTKAKSSQSKPSPASEPVESGPGGVPIVEMPASYDLLRSIQIWQGAPKTGKTSTADMDELVDQAIDKLFKFTGIQAGREKAESFFCLSTRLKNFGWC